VKSKYNLACGLLGILLAAPLCLSNIVRAQTPDYPLFYTDNIYSVPDLMQTDERADFPGGGADYCCLVAIANSLIWLDSNGFPNLVENSGNQFDDEVKLAKLLGSKAYMNTRLGVGTGTANIIRGLKKYLYERGYEVNQLEYQGWRNHSEEIKKHPLPQLDWIKRGILDKGLVWLNVGWYKYDPSKEEYERIAGHWVTLVGYGKDENGRLDSNILILHDPSPRAGHDFSNEYASAVRINRGSLVGKETGLPRSAVGYYKLGGGMHIKKETDTAIIDGVIALKLETKSDNSRNRETAAKIGNSAVLKDEPKDVGAPKINLSKAERLENFNILAEAIDKNYSFFAHKNINWPDVTTKYRQKIEMAETDEEFYLLIYKFVRELKDFHSWLCNYKDVPELGRFSPQMHTRLIEGKCVVTQVGQGSEAREKGFSAGCVIVGVDGVNVEKRIENIKPLMHVYSSQRCFLEQAHRRILDGKENSFVSVKFIAPDGSTKIVKLKRVSSKDEEIIKPDFNVTKGKFIWYGIHPSGYGYIRILSFQGRMEIADEFDNALEKLKNTPSLIIDLRENPGGFGTSHKRIIGRFITSRTKVDIGYIKNGPGHEDFTRNETYFEPIGNWQYTKPIALLTNAITGSACDLFVCRMVSTGRPITIGTSTHGNSTGTCIYALLPCNLVVRISAGYVCDAGGKIIEGNGNIPKIQVEPAIADVLNQVDSVIERAVKELQLYK
jgi:C-terminal processing protease CtpA/Prc